MTGLISPVHIIVLLVVLLLVFGTKRLPELGRSLGSSMREFKSSIGAEPPDDPAALAAPAAPEAVPTPAAVVAAVKDPNVPDPPATPAAV